MSPRVPKILTSPLLTRQSEAAEFTVAPGVVAARCPHGLLPVAIPRPSAFDFRVAASKLSPKPYTLNPRTKLAAGDVVAVFRIFNQVPCNAGFVLAKWEGKKALVLRGLVEVQDREPLLQS